MYTKQVGLPLHLQAFFSPSRPPQIEWFHTCITTEAGPRKAAWAQQIIFQPIQDHGLRRVMGCPLTADWKWMVDRAHVTCIPFTHRWLVTSCKVNHSTLRKYPRSQTLINSPHTLMWLKPSLDQPVVVVGLFPEILCQLLQQLSATQEKICGSGRCFWRTS